MDLQTQIIRLENDNMPEVASPGMITKFLGALAPGQGYASLDIENFSSQKKYFIFSVRETDRLGNVIEEIGGTTQSPLAEV